ncbi:MAG TPA: hypothetical protein VNW15_14570 [Rhizomicrobium sp.]|nr:hypothetical protein [Rhizomicrobium sp.]
MSDLRIETAEIADATVRELSGRRAINSAIWFCMALFWVAYGLCVAGFLAVSSVGDPRTLYHAIAGGAVNVETNASQVSGIAIFAVVVVALAGLAIRKWSLVKSRSVWPWWYAASGLLVAIPLGLVFSLATPIAYVRDYAAYLRLAQSLYSTGDYSDISEGNFTGVADTLAWRPPGMALLYGLPIHLGIPPQLSVWLVNSVIALTIFFFVKRSLRGGQEKGPATLVAFAGLIVCLTTLPFFLLPIAHPPAVAILVLLLLLVPTQGRLLAHLDLFRWLLAGFLIGASALFRPNLVLLVGVLAAAVLLAQAQFCGHRFIRKSAAAVLLCLLGAAIAIGPWTARNWVTFHRFVPISTNGGMVFYSANGSPKASEQGKYVQALAIQLFKDVPNEVDRDHEGLKRGLANIAAHPAAFVESFAYRVPRLLTNPLFPIGYIRDQAPGAPATPMLPLLEAATIIAFWCLWGLMFVHWRAIRARILDTDRIAWPHVSLLVTFFISLLFENSATFQQSFLPFLLFIWFDARKLALPMGVVLKR